MQKKNFFFRFVLLAMDKNSACEKDRLQGPRNDLHFVDVSEESGSLLTELCLLSLKYVGGWWVGGGWWYDLNHQNKSNSNLSFFFEFELTLPNIQVTG